VNPAGSRYEQGLATRREVLGAEYVDRALDNVTEFTEPIQQLVTEYCWGAVWTRDGLDRKTRSILNLGMLTAMNRQHELAAHVRGALNNGCTPVEIREVLLQSAIYCGLPAALDAFRTAAKAIDEATADG
jgi:4-carboxymuconolactone decarboxylase